MSCYWSLEQARSRQAFPSVGDQLSFVGVLFAGVPWEGRSPRALTRGALGLIFKPQGVKSVSDFVDPEQYDLFPEAKEKAPWKYQGAPLLVDVRHSPAR